MRSSIFVSILLHVVVIVLGVYGLPAIRKPPVIEDIPMVVEIVPVGAMTNLPSAPEPPKEPKKKEVKPPKPPPAPKVKKAPPPPPPAPKKEAVVVPPPPEPKPKEKPKPKPKVEAKSKPKPKPKAKPKPKPPTSLAKAKPRPKPKPPDRFAMVLKNLEKDLKKAPPKKAETKKKKPEADLMARLTKSLSRKPTEYDPNKRVTMSERHAMINLVKRTMEPCWNFQAGSKKAQDIIVEIEVALRPDGHVSTASITNRSQLQSDPFKLAAGESALRAVLNPSCQPYKLPANKYAVWKDLKLTFNPREMLGR